MTLTYLGKGTSPSFSNVWEIMHLRRLKDPFYKRVWASTISKTANFLWRLCLKWLSAIDKIQAQRGNT